jgi:hypothetical protein
MASIGSPVLAESAPVPEGYFQKSLPNNLILGTFFAVTLPLAAFIWLNNSQFLLWVYLWLFGMTHFVVTFTIYLNRANLAHFGSSWQNRIVYFALPALIFIGFDLVHVLHLREAFPLFALYFFAAIRLMDFNHFTRQAFGVLQMFKGASGDKYPKRSKNLENWCFKAGTILLLTTFLAGGVSPFLQDGGPLTIVSLGWTLGNPMLPIPILQIVEAIVGIVFLGLLATAIVCHRRTRISIDRIWIDKPLAYLLFQAAGTLLATIAFPLYAAALAIHYVEYQVLMYPRCFRSPLDETSRVDRFYARLRRSPIIFYMAVLAMAGLVTAFCFTGMGMAGMTTMDLFQPPAYLVVIALFDGLFVFHYLVEAYIWRFSEPYYRNSLSGLYFRTPTRTIPALP